MARPTRHRLRIARRRMAGMGLVEIMVALLIGMFGVLVMTQVLSVSEEQKRTTTSGNDAMNEGVLGLYSLQSDIRMAGYGINDQKLLGCALTLRPGVTLNNLAPVVINSGNITGKDTNTDSLLIFYAGTTGTTEGDNIINTANAVQTPSVFSPNDWVVVGPAIRPSPCTLTLERVASVTGNILTLASGAVMNNGDTLFNLGQSYRAVGYAIRSGNLSICDFAETGRDCTQASAWTSIASNMVSLRVQYGRDTRVLTPASPMGVIVDTYDQATPTTSCGWSRAGAVRLALVARSAQVEKTNVTTAVPVWEGSFTPSGAVAAKIVLPSPVNGTWLQYRYKLFQTTVPMRNVSWKGMVSGC